MAITELKSTSHLDEVLSASTGEKLSVIDFYATWCGPCRAIAPKFKSLSETYTNVNFLKCDVDNVGDVAARYSVSAMPTFIFIKGKTQVEQVRGANASALEEAVRRLSSGETSAFSGKGQTLGGSSPQSSAASADLYNISPQAKLLLGLVAAYFVLWYLSS